MGTISLITIILLTLCSRSRFTFSGSLQEPPAGVVLLCSEALRRVISRFKPFLGHTPIIYHFTYKAPLNGQISHHSGIYNNRMHPGIKEKRHQTARPDHNRPEKSRKTAKNPYQNYGISTTFSTSKTFGVCVIF